MVHTMEYKKEMKHNKRSSIQKLQQNIVASLGIQAWLIESIKKRIYIYLEDIISDVIHENSPNKTDNELKNKKRSGTNLQNIQDSVKEIREHLKKLDDVKDYTLIESVDDDFYQLWKELERKMQMHRQSEAKFQLKDMFKI